MRLGVEVACVGMGGNVRVGPRPRWGDFTGGRGAAVFTGRRLNVISCAILRSRRGSQWPGRKFGLRRGAFGAELRVTPGPAHCGPRSRAVRMNAANGETRSRGAGTHFEMYLLDQTVRWRLLSANNRDSGQSAESFADAESCRAALDHLLAVIKELQPLHSLTADQRWEWKLSLGNVVLARSSRSFDRRLRCEAACDWFVRMAPSAAISSTLRVVLGRNSAPVVL